MCHAQPRSGKTTAHMLHLIKFHFKTYRKRKIEFFKPKYCLHPVNICSLIHNLKCQSLSFSTASSPYVIICSHTKVTY